MKRNECETCGAPLPANYSVVKCAYCGNEYRNYPKGDMRWPMSVSTCSWQGYQEQPQFVGLYAGQPMYRR